MVELVIILACLLPTAAYVIGIYWVDRYEKEPIWLLSATFFWGAVPSIIVAIILNELFSLPFTFLVDEALFDMASAAIVAPIVEETVKGMALLGIVFYRRRDIDSPLDGIIYGAMIGLGFAMIENIFYFVQAPADEFNFLVILRSYIFGLNHSFFTAITGIGIAISRLNRTTSIKIIAPIQSTTHIRQDIGGHHDTRKRTCSEALRV